MSLRKMSIYYYLGERTMRKIQLPLTEDVIKSLKAGEHLLLSGKIITSRDAGHKRMIGLINSGKPLPFDLKTATIYYAGPCPKKPTNVIGSIGPTTSYRVDDYTPQLLDLGLKGMIGKGNRTKPVVDSIIKNKCIYFSAIGGAGALYSKCVKECKILGFEDLLSEALHQLTIEDFPVICAIDSNGDTIF